jgi:hypothetical protein
MVEYCTLRKGVVRTSYKEEAAYPIANTRLAYIPLCPPREERGRAGARGYPRVHHSRARSHLFEAKPANYSSA